MGWGCSSFPGLWLGSFPQLLGLCWSQGSVCRLSPFFQRFPSFLGRPRSFPNPWSLKSQESVWNTCPSLGRKGGAWRVAARTRGLGGCKVPPLLITSPPRQSSSAPGVHPHTPRQGERPAATPSWLHFASALLRGRRTASTRGRWPGRAEYTAPGSGGGHPDGGPRGRAHSPQSLLARGLGPDWLAASGKRDLGQTGWHPHSIKNRF